MKIQRIPLKDIYHSIILWCLLIYGGGFWGVFQPWNRILLIVIFALLVSEPIKKKKISKKVFGGILICLSYVLLLYLIHRPLNPDFNSYASIALSITIIFLYNDRVGNRERFIKLFEYVMFFICAYSCIIFSLNLIFRFISPDPNELFKLWMGQNLKCGVRNSGPFWEPGIFQIYIIIALYFALFFFRNQNGKFPYWHVAVYIITLITTFSTTGYILIGGLLLWKYIIWSIHTTHTKMGLILLAPFVVFSGIAIILSSSVVSDKFEESNNSFIIRSYEAAETPFVIYDAGVFGKGVQTMARRTLMLQHNMGGEEGDTNSVGYSSTASMYGWLTLFLFMIRILYVCRRDFKEHGLLLYGIMLVTWTTGAIMLVPLYYFFFVGFRGEYV